ncbi:PTS sugar transporter subunit IIA [Desulfonema magnum]|uniref:Phosphotransferase domain-containing protein n=1 Tax=Desulfonema magnum TaxID=45655 RepID=A0A975BFB4_9BACT|nr:PTS sugar transporter subunit IIA [Desulfonema magnum]QTA84263.1 Phosphotransferase domain-containing protein [Desulfonema magnum]
MKIWKYLRPENLFLDVSLPDKDTTLRFVADACVQNGVVTDGNMLCEGMKEREKTMSTGIGSGIALPHTTSHETEDAAVLLIRPAVPVDFESLDNLPADIILALIIPENQTALHLQILAGVSRLCKNPSILKAMREANNSEELWKKIRNLEEKMAFH